MKIQYIIKIKVEEIRIHCELLLFHRVNTVSSSRRHIRIASDGHYLQAFTSILKSNVSLSFVTIGTTQGLSNGFGTKNACNTREDRMKGQVFLFGLVKSTSVKPCLSVLFLLLSAQSHSNRIIFLHPSLNIFDHPVISNNSSRVIIMHTCVACHRRHDSNSAILGTVRLFG